MSDASRPTRRTQPTWPTQPSRPSQPTRASEAGQASGASQTGEASDPSWAGERPARGVWLGVDVGSVRVGVARSDPRGVLAVPVETVARDRKHGGDFARLIELIATYESVGVVVGLPLTLSGEHGPSAALATAFADELRARIDPIPVTLADERLSTAVSMRILSANGVRARAGRAVIDQIAAVQILQGWLDAHSRPTEVE